MSRIRLEWHIESQSINKSDSEDPAARRARRRNIFLLLLLICILVGLVIAGLLIARQRLIDVQTELEQLLHDTVRAEVAALRIGDDNTFLNIQRSATDEWLNRQQATFQNYASRKATQQLELTGNILATSIEDQRARVVVEEIVNGLSYANVWFYWRYAEGWHHVPPDYTFWGAEFEVESDALRISYREVDKLFARQMHESLGDWLAAGCKILRCGQLPQMTVEIVTNSPKAVMWLNEDRLQLQVKSPYVDGARTDLPFGTALRMEVAGLLAERLMKAQLNDLTVAYPHDAYQLRMSAISYLVEEFARVDTGATLMRSLAHRYGGDTIGQLMSLLTPTADMSIVQQALPVPVDQANLDWRDFISWRLNTESELIASRSENNWLNLYDTSSTETVRIAAYQRFNANAPAPPYLAMEQQLSTNPDGSVQLRMRVQAGSGNNVQEQIISFNLVQNSWKRAS